MQCVGQSKVISFYFKLMLLKLYIPQADSCIIFLSVNCILKTMRH